MKEWYIEEINNEVYVLHGEKFTNKKKIYPNETEIEEISNIEFYLLYNDDCKLVGYQLNYKYPEKAPKYLTYNSFGIVYNKRKNNFTTTFEVIFEDATIRLLTYVHSPIGVKDYFLVGRWRSPTSKEEVYNG